MACSLSILKLFVLGRLVLSLVFGAICFAAFVLGRKGIKLYQTRLVRFGSCLSLDPKHKP